jgi:proteasome lid subunit RPN8/RPN11
MISPNPYLDQFSTAIDAAKAHARSVYPEESCGFIVKGEYIPVTNQAGDPAEHTKDVSCRCRLCAFAISDADYLKVAKDLQMVVHSHPGGPAYPSKTDMAHQEISGVTWAIITLDEERFGPVTVWGGDCPTEKLIEREFIHGINDCYSLIRDVFALGREGMKAQGMDWPHDPITLPVYPRNDQWWERDNDNFYETKPQEIGFVEVQNYEVRPGDVFLCKIRSNQLNHGGVLLGNNLILHHLPQRLSRREPAGLWSRTAEKWIRYVGEQNA